MVNTQPSPSAPPQAKVDLAPPDEPAANNGSVAIDLDTMPVTSAVPIVRDAKVGGIVIDSAGAKSKSEDGSGKCCTRKKVLLVSLAVLVVAAVGVVLAILLTPKSCCGEDDSARSSTANVKAHPLLPDCKVPNPSLVGDGMCNGGLYNTAECLWDAGDCIYYNTMYPNCHVPNPSLIGDGKCDGDEYSTEQCDWDGGDCPVAEDEDTPDVVATEPNTGSEVLPQGGTPSAPTSDGGNTAKPQEPQKETSVYVQPDTPASTTPSTPASTTPTTPTTDNQEPSSEPNFPTIVTSDATCSLRSDHHYCTADDSCVELEVEECTVYCQDEQACKSAEFADSVVSCYGGSSCYGAEFHRSEVSCLKEKDWPCKYSDFLASAVVCENNNGSNSCFYSTFDPCSCCDGPDCPSGIASCSGSGLQAFCSSIHLGKTCKEWGNPACNA